MNLFNTIIQCNKSFCFNWTPNVRYWNSIKVRWKVAPGYNCSLKHECPVWQGVNKHSKIHWKECFNALYEFTVFMLFFMKQIFFLNLNKHFVCDRCTGALVKSLCFFATKINSCVMFCPAFCLHRDFREIAGIFYGLCSYTQVSQCGSFPAFPKTWQNSVTLLLYWRLKLLFDANVRLRYCWWEYNSDVNVFIPSFWRV